MKMITLTIAAAIASVLPAAAKDKEITLAEAPAGVQATIKKTVDAGAILEKVEIESTGTLYEAKITDKNGIRWGIFMTADGKVARTEQKKPKKK